MKVRIGFGLGTRTGGAGGDRLLGIVDDLERLGFDSLWLSERVSGEIPDPLVALAVAAGRTRHLKLGTSVLVLPGRNPVLLAKELASLDALSQGRLLPAVGLGAVDPVEQAAFGVRREERAPLFDEVLPLLRRLWTGEAVHHDGPRYHVDGLRLQPTPVDRHLDVWLGGLAPSELRRCGRLGDGWLPSFCTAADVAAGIPEVQAEAEAHGRAIDPEHFGALIAYRHGPLPEGYAAFIARRRPEVDPGELIPEGLTGVRRTIEAMVDAGASKFVVLPLTDPDDWTAELEAIAAGLLPLQT